MAICDICGCNAGLFSSRHAHCEAERQSRLRDTDDAISNIVASLRRGEQPEVNLIDSPIVMGKGERPIYAFGGVSTIVEKAERVWRGGSVGMSVRVAKGMTMRLGQSRGRSVSETVLTKDDCGWLFITTHNLHFYGVRRGIKLGLPSIEAYRLEDQTLIIDIPKKRHLFQFTDTHANANGTASNALSILNAILSFDDFTSPPTPNLRPASGPPAHEPIGQTLKPPVSSGMPQANSAARSTFGKRGLPS